MNPNSDAQGADQIERSPGEIHPNTSISTMNINYFPSAREAHCITALFDKDTSFLIPAADPEGQALLANHLTSAENVVSLSLSQPKYKDFMVIREGNRNKKKDMVMCSHGRIN